MNAIYVEADIWIASGINSMHLDGSLSSSRSHKHCVIKQQFLCVLFGCWKQSLLRLDHRKEKLLAVGLICQYLFSVRKENVGVFIVRSHDFLILDPSWTVSTSDVIFFSPFILILALLSSDFILSLSVLRTNLLHGICSWWFTIEWIEGDEYRFEGCDAVSLVECYRRFGESGLHFQGV